MCRFTVSEGSFLGIVRSTQDDSIVGGWNIVIVLAENVHELCLDFCYLGFQLGLLGLEIGY